MPSLNKLGSSLHKAPSQASAPAGTAPSAAPLEEIAKKVIQGLYGNGADRVNKLRAEGFDPDAVQKLVNEMLKAPASVSIDEIAKKVIQGLYGVGADRVNRLRAEGFDPDAVQKRVNEMLKG